MLRRVCIAVAEATELRGVESDLFMIGRANLNGFARGNCEMVSPLGWWAR
jgi:hypothetical protein